MSDRSKKILWIAIAISGFALIVCIAAFVLFSPNEVSQSKPFDLTGRSPAKPESPNDFSAFPSIVVQSSEADASPQADEQSSQSAQTSPQNSVIVVPPPSTPTPSTPATTQKQATPTPPSSPTTTSSAPKSSTAAPKPAPSSTEYWIQVGSFSEKATADKLKEEFTHRSMTAIIATKVVSGRNYYQVKVGPYASVEEAKKWLTSVKAVPGSSQDSFVTSR
jgi:cell division protein FtsN